MRFAPKANFQSVVYQQKSQTRIRIDNQQSRYQRKTTFEIRQNYYA